MLLKPKPAAAVCNDTEVTCEEKKGKAVKRQSLTIGKSRANQQQILHRKTKKSSSTSGIT